jgi:hypothetical protein
VNSAVDSRRRRQNNSDGPAVIKNNSYPVPATLPSAMVLNLASNSENEDDYMAMKSTDHNNARTTDALDDNWNIKHDHGHDGESRCRPPVIRRQKSS